MTASPDRRLSADARSQASSMFCGRQTAWLVGIIAAWTIPAAALAIGPNDQKIPDDPSPLSLRATGWFGSGTGTVVGTKLVGTTGYAAILTANHVADNKPATLKLGSLIGGAQPWLEIATTGAFSTYVYKDATKNPMNLPVDVALMLGKVNNLTQGSQALAKFNLLSTNLPTIVDPTQDPGNPLLAAKADNPVGFTQLGYGQLAEYAGFVDIGLGGTVRAYQSTEVSGERLFQNNMALEFVPPAEQKDPITKKPSYYHSLVKFRVIGPPNNQGQRLGTGGDSGGPLYTEVPSAATRIQVTRGSNVIQIPIDYTDSLSAVFVASEVFPPLPPNSPTVPVGASQFAVPIDAALYNWMRPLLANPMLIPEPATLVLLAVGSFMLMLRRRRPAHSIN